MLLDFRKQNGIVIQCGFSKPLLYRLKTWGNNHRTVHCTDIFHELAHRNTELASDDSKLTSDTLLVAKSTLHSAFALEVATVHSHYVYERYMCMSKDTRPQCSQLRPHKAARLVPYNDDEFLFGKEREVLTKNIEERRREITPDVRVQQATPKPAHVPIHQQNFRRDGGRGGGG